jgi:hypothetical protein
MPPANKNKKPFVVVRTYSAGVHFGTLESRAGQEVVLSDARRLWRWNGANTLNEVATKGVDVKNSKVSESAPLIELTQAIEVIHTSDAGETALRSATWVA